MDKLNAGQKHMLKLIDRDKDVEGWAKVSGMMMPLLETTMPKELIELTKNDDGTGRVRLTEQGCSVVGAMAFL